MKTNGRCRPAQLMKTNCRCRLAQTNCRCRLAQTNCRCRLAQTNFRCRLAQLMKTNSRCQAHLALSMKARSYQLLRLTHPISPSHQRQHHGALARICKGADVAGATKMETLLPIPPQASAGKSTTK